jgi:hypothetical protein
MSPTSGQYAEWTDSASMSSTPKETDVRSRAAPGHAKEKPLCPCRSLQGAK